MHFGRTFFYIVIALTVALPGSALAQDRMSMSALDPAAFAALQRALTPGVLKDLGYDNIDAATKGALVSVAPSDCPAACNADVALGMCLCAPQSDGGCPAKGAPVATDAAGLCKTLPANVTIFASEGGLGTTRVVSLIPSR